MIDLVYVLGKGSLWNDKEIKYSLRSVNKYLSGFRNIFIIGELPEFIHNVIHIPHSDMEMNKEANIKQKILAACDNPDISTNFLFLNDDHFLLSDFDAQTFPYYYKGTLGNLLARKRRGLYYRAVDRTYRHLLDKSSSTLHFDTHCPIVYNKDKFRKVISEMNWETRCGIIIKSLYCNRLGIEGIKEPDCKINKLCSKEEILSIIKERKFFSIGNRALNNNLEEVLEQLYPEKSPWEK